MSGFAVVTGDLQSGHSGPRIVRQPGHPRLRLKAYDATAPAPVGAARAPSEPLVVGTAHCQNRGMSWPSPEQVNPDRYANRIFSLTPSSDRTDLIPDPPDPDADHRPWAAALMVVGWLLAAALTLFTRGSRSFQEGPSTRENYQIIISLMESTTMAGLILAIIGTAVALSLPLGRWKTGAAIVSAALAGIALAVSLSGWNVISALWSRSGEHWWAGGLLIDACLTMVLGASIAEIHRLSSPRNQRK